MRPLYVYYRRLKAIIAQAELSKRSQTQPNQPCPPSQQGQAGSGKQDVREDVRRAGAAGQAATESQIAALEARLEMMLGEKATIRAKLQAFQEKFVAEHNRKIRFHKDILPIEREYRMYKILKADIAKVETQLRNLCQEY
eukprot:NODE_14012_length_1133_cov_9.714712.p2 GENE.NODE_14012_length_1133_cov_9.714712~~NODE_14012_length_1133_cov_9.714712.p2  ORF type:complete len:140 (-),score=44.97 NODE_14012_length_1133_cov_9.714712:443-862(-)